MVLALGTHLGPYEILSQIGAGGMGEVYRAKDSRLKREVAIKILSVESLDTERQRRFKREAQAASALNHPNILVVYDIGIENGRNYIVSELVEGEPLRRLIQKGPISTKKLLDLAVQIADGLATAHQEGIVHRDLKPENIMITPEGRVKILDFGLAKLIDVESSGRDAETISRALSNTGIIQGTVPYMSPEQATGSAVDFRSDQFSFGSILYEMATAKRPFQRETAPQTLSAIISDEPAPVFELNPKLPAPVQWLIERCLAKDPQHRYDSTRDLYRDLRNLNDHLSRTSTSTILPAAHTKNFWLLGIMATLLVIALAATSIILYKKPPITVATPALFYHRLSYRNGYISTARFAPDGQTIVYSGAFEGRPRELFLTRTEGVESHPLGILGADVLSISPTGQMAILLRRETTKAEGGYTGVLAEVPLAGGGPRQLADQVSAACWTPDGSKLAIVRRIAGRSRLEFPPGRLLYESEKLIRQPRFSPKGDFIALGKFPHDSVVIINLRGKTIAKSAVLWPDGLAWSPKSDEVWFTTGGPETGSGSELHALTVSGQERLIERFPVAYLKDISVDGHLLMSFDENRVIANGLLDHEERNLSWLDDSRVAGLSADGKSIAIYDSGQGSEAPIGTTYFRKTDGSPAVRLGAGVALDLAADGTYVLSYLPDPFRFVLYPTGIGETKVVKIDRLHVLDACLLHDRKRIIFTGNDPSLGSRVYIQEIGGRQPAALTPLGVELLSETVSLDDQFFIGRTKDNKTLSYSLKGGVPRPIAGLKDGEIPIQWGNDGKSIYVYAPSVLSAEVYLVNTFNGKRTFIKKFMPSDSSGVGEIGPIYVTPDGKTFAYSYGRTLSTLYLINGPR